VIVEITSQGRPIARIAPLSEDPLAATAASLPAGMTVIALPS